MSLVLPTFRPMQMADLDAVMAIEPTIYSHPWTRTNFADSLRAGHSGWVMLIAGEIIGYGVMMLALDEAELLNVSIKKIKQNQGFGTIMLQHFIKIAKQHSAANIFLEVRQSNAAAIVLYEKLGFNEMSVRRNYYPSHNGREDAILMGLTL